MNQIASAKELIAWGFRPLEAHAYRAAEARRMRLNAKKQMQTCGAEKVEQWRQELMYARTVWREATAALWRHHAKMKRGEA